MRLGVAVYEVLARPRHANREFLIRSSLAPYEGPLERHDPERDADLDDGL